MPITWMLLTATALAGAPALEESEILAGAEARIREHRTSEATLALTDASTGRPVPAGATVRIEETRHAFLFGCNIFALGRCRTAEDEAAYRERFTALLNYATAPFYWWSYERVRGRPDHARTEEILSFCRKHAITVKGHPLAWNFVDPPWLPPDPKEAMDLQIARVGSCVHRFREDIGFWDVVNEATGYDRPFVRKRAPRLTGAIDRAGVGEYVRRAFRAARRANPKATLVINDYRLDPRFEKRVLKELVDSSGQPLYDVIGLQSHQHGGARPVTEIWEACERFARHGKPLHWTENTFVSGEEGWDLPKKRPGFRWKSTPEGEARQAEDAARFYTVLFSHPAVEAITWWDFSDQRAWQGAPAGLLRADMTPKPAYERLHALIKEKWWTRVEKKAGELGRASFRGFLGEYRVSAKVGDREITGTFTLAKGHAEPIEVRLK